MGPPANMMRLDFSESAEDIRFNMEGDGAPILRARLQTVDGGWEDRDINLTERIMNRDGQLCFGRFCDTPFYERQALLTGHSGAEQ